jgi:ATP-dependent Lon protease
MEATMSSLKNATVAVLPLRTGALFPHTVVPFAVGRARSVALLRTLAVGDVIATFGQRSPETGDPVLADLFETGTVARVKAIERKTSEEYLLVLEGLGRVTLRSLETTGTHLTGVVDALEETETTRVEAMDALRHAVENVEGRQGELLSRVEADTPGAYADRIAATVGLTTELATEILQLTDVEARLVRLLEIVEGLKTEAEVREKIDRNVRKEFGKTQREAVLREQMKAIKRELGDGDESSDADRLRERIQTANLPEEAAKVAERELKRLEASNGTGPAANVIRNYLELIADLPWNARAEAKDDIGAIEDKLNADHHGMDDVKKRIVEHMAVLKMAETAKGTLLCLVGPPGVGKTSLGQSIADATGRPFVRVALGGVRDEAEIRGHRRTYVGALPGRILHALKKAKVKNPVILLDEIDKLGTGWGGSPEAALLEVLDPEQNQSFTDHYLELPFDLSEVLFVCTANTLETLSGPLRDRLEIVELTGYTPDEKVHIAQKHLVPKRKKEFGLTDKPVQISATALSAIVRGYTREAGVRQLDRQITKLLRSLTLDLARGTLAEKQVEEVDLRERLGRVKFEEEGAEKSLIPGIATGLAWTPVGGSILFIETSKMPGKGRVEITGQLGDVMKESARAAFSYVRTHAAELGLGAQNLEEVDVHIHVPAGATPKDGPSAGVTIFTALVSLFTGRALVPNTAMTGECTLRGRVLPVGGIKSKVLAAHRAGVKRVILPKKCEADLDEVPESIKAELEIFFVTDMHEVLAHALMVAPIPEAPIANVGAAQANGGLGV